MTHQTHKELENKFILPFATSSQNRAKAFTKDMEMAAILYLADSNREKGEGIILKKPDEKLVFITEAHYPIWLIPYSGRTLLLDGLGVSKTTLSYDTPPDITAFKNDVERNSKTHEAYSVMLSRNANYFQNYVGKEEKTIDQLIASPDFQQDFDTYLPHAKSVETLFARPPMPPTVDELEISTSIEQLSDLKTKISDDARNLDATMRLLSETTLEKVKEIRHEVESIRKQFNRQLRRVEPKVTRNVRCVQKKFHKRISRTTKSFEKQLRHLHEKQAELERTRKHLIVETHRCEARIKSSKHRKNKQSRIQWTKRLDRIKKKLPTLGKNINDVHTRIVDVEAAERSQVSQLRIECDTRIGEATKVLRELEASREAELTVKKQEITSLESATSLIISQMNEMAKSKKAALNQLDELSIPQRKRTVSLVYLPFYLVRYEMEARKRYTIYPPSTVSDMGIMTKMKGALGAAKMKEFLQPRSKAITTFLDQFVTLIQANPMFEKEVTDAGIEDSVLRIKTLRLGAKRGLKELENEEWMSQDELQTIAKLLYIYA